MSQAFINAEHKAVACEELDGPNQYPELNTIKHLWDKPEQAREPGSRQGTIAVTSDLTNVLHEEEMKTSNSHTAKSHIIKCLLLSLPVDVMVEKHMDGQTLRKRLMHFVSFSSS